MVVQELSVASPKSRREDVDSAQRTETKGRLCGLEAAFSTKVVTTVTEYVWKFEASYEVSAFRGIGSEPADRTVIYSRSCTHEIVTGTKNNPRFEAKIHPNVDVDISWVLRHINPVDLGVAFKINREDEKCKTPRRNKDVNDALQSLRALTFWSSTVNWYFSSHLFTEWRDH